MKTKTCPRCKLIKTINYFNKDKKKPDGFRYECRECQSFQTKRDSELRRIKVNEKRFKQVFSSLSDSAKKVYSCVPSESECKDTLKGEGVFQVSDVANQMKKIGFTADKRHILGVLDSLKNSGLLAEPSEGYFKKINIKRVQLIKHDLSSFVEREKIVTFIEVGDHEKNKSIHLNSQNGNADQLNKEEKAMSQKESSNNASQNIKTPAKPIEKIGLLVMSAQKIMCDLKQLCEDIETVAIEVEQMFESSSKDAVKLRQLQSLLKGLDG